MKGLIVTDNKFVFNEFRKIIASSTCSTISFDYACSPVSAADFVDQPEVVPVDVKSESKNLASKYQLIFSCHSKKIFPPELVESTRCINIHPGYNPYNRGWYPQVFSLINGNPIGATIHEMDSEIDHGPIICQKLVESTPEDTSLTLYKKVLEAEIGLFSAWYERLVNHDYTSYLPQSEGNYNGVRDFEALCHLDLNHVGTFREHIDILRALTHGDYDNAYYAIGDEKFSIKLEVRKVLR